MLMTICMVMRHFFDQKTHCGLPCVKQGLTDHNSAQPAFMPVHLMVKIIIKNNLKRKPLKDKHKKMMAMISSLYAIYYFFLHSYLELETNLFKNEEVYATVKAHFFVSKTFKISIKI